MKHHPDVVTNADWGPTLPGSPTDGLGRDFRNSIAGDERHIAGDERGRALPGPVALGGSKRRTPRVAPHPAA